MRADEIERVRAELGEFVGEVFASLARKDQRAKGGLYLQGLMLEGRRKSMGNADASVDSRTALI